MTVERIKKDIIDNTYVTMHQILNSEIPNAKRFDVSTGYFDVAGYGMLRCSIENAAKDKAFSMRLLLGREAILPKEDSFEKYAEQYREDSMRDTLSVKSSLEGTKLTPKSLDNTASLIRLLENNQNIQVRLGTSRFNHSKCYILGNNSVFIGSSNLTAGGMTRNYELNAGLYQPGVAETTRQWFDRMWGMAEDTRQDLIDVLKQSKFGTPPEPYPVYMKMLFERFRPLLENVDEDHTRDNKSLTRFQQEAVRTSLFIVSDFGGVIIADATGLGKTNMGIEIVRQKVLREGKRVLLVAPAQVLRSMWKEKLKEVDINVREMLTMESLGREDILDTLGKYRNIDFVLIDESQNFRSKGANRRRNLMKLMSVGKRKQAVLLTATPINNSLMDLYYQLSIITGEDDSYFYRTIGIPDLYQHMRDAANKDGLQQGLEKIQQLLDTVMVRRTRSYIKEVYKDDKINGREIKFPAHQYSPLEYSLTGLFGNIFQKILDDLNSLTMAPYGLERYDTSLSEEERSKYRAAGHLQVILLLKRFESSIRAVTISLENKVNLYKYISRIIDDGRILRVRDFNKIITKWNLVESGEDQDTDEEAKTKFFFDEINKVATEKIGKNYDAETLKHDIHQDMEILQNLLAEVKKITIDTKFEEVIKTILRERALELESRKVLIFTEYTATAKYITKLLGEKLSVNVVECITGDTRPETRMKFIRRFAPKSNLLEDEKLDEPEIDVLVSTEVLAEGQNLQDCNYVINYDLPWNPMRIVQRTGRIDRLTSTYDVIRTRACYPEMELDAILTLMGKLISKIKVADTVIGGDVEILGEVPTPRQFNGTVMGRIKVLADKNSDSGRVIETMERESDVMPTTTPFNELGRYIKEKGMESMQEIPMGRRSGKKHDGQTAVLAYLQERPERRVYFVNYDFKTGKAYVPDDEYDSIRAVSCTDDTPRHLPMDGADNRESFELLLGIDQQARKAIMEHNDRVLKYVTELQTRKRKQHDKNISEINKIITDSVMHGKITQDEGMEILNIVKSEYIRPWEDEIGRFLNDYNSSQELDGLLRGIRKMNDWIGIQEKTENIKKKEEVQRTEPELKLVGAMFLAGDRFDANLGRRGLDKF